MNRASPTDLASIARLIAIAAGNCSQASYLAESSRAPAAVVSVLKAAASAGSTSDPSFASALAESGVTSAFIEGLRSRSVLARLLVDGAVRMPLRTRASIVIANASAWVTGEGLPVPVSAMSLAGHQLEEREAAALIVLSAEMLRSTSTAGRALLDSALRGGVADALDAAFLDLVTDGVTPIGATGTTPAAALTDLRALLDAVNATGASSLFFLVGPDTANTAATLAGTDGTLTFPAMGPNGGEILNTPALVSTAVLSGQIVLVDASGIAAEIEAITISLADQATVEMSDTPGAPPNAASVLVSLWQSNMVGLLARAFFGAERVRAGSVAILDGAEWGAAP